jgi:hypothetical protein
VDGDEATGGVLVALLLLLFTTMAVATVDDPLLALFILIRFAASFVFTFALIIGSCIVDLLA